MPCTCITQDERRVVECVRRRVACNTQRRCLPAGTRARLLTRPSREENQRQGRQASAGDNNTTCTTTATTTTTNNNNNNNNNNHNSVTNR